MIKNYVPKPFIGTNQLPNYVSNVKKYILNGTITGGYIIRLAKLTVGESTSNGVILSHARFQSYSDHGKRKSDIKTRVSGYNREFNAIKNVMFEAGVEFDNVTFGSTEEIINALGEWFKRHNSDILSYSLMSQN